MDGLLAAVGRQLGVIVVGAIGVLCVLAVIVGWMRMRKHEPRR